MKPYLGIRILVKTLTRWIYPQWCVLCQKLLYLTENHLCRACYSSLTEITPPICKHCGLELPRFEKGYRRSVCSRCRNDAVKLDGTLSLFRYDKVFQNILHQIKFRKRDWLLEIFRKKIGRTLESNIDFHGTRKPSQVIPVPLDPKRLRKRKFNQSLLISQITSKILNIPVRENILLRKHSRDPQSWLNRRERMRNLEDLFTVRYKKSLKDQWVLLVDDVVTTGATVKQCAQTLKAAGANRVSVFSLARTLTP